jgi:hypothetical protein
VFGGPSWQPMARDPIRESRALEASLPGSDPARQGSGTRRNCGQRADSRYEPGQHSARGKRCV